MIELALPYPVSANRYWRNMRGRMIRSAEANAYRASVAREAMVQRVRPLHGCAVEVLIVLHPRTTKAGKASESRIDLDNCIKVVLDALNSVAYADDKQVVKLTAEVGGSVPGGGLSVAVGTLTC